jgi:hypothetical protein
MLEEMWGSRVLTAGRQVREESGFYVPDYIAADSRPDLYAAADEQARDLRSAEKHLDDALNLAGVLRASLHDAGDSRAMQADTVLKLIEKLLRKAHNCIDRHDTLYLNLFMAYFDLKESPCGHRDDGVPEQDH